MKPMVIKLKEAKANILETVSATLRSGIPAYLLEPIVAEVHTQVSNAAQNEYERALKIEAEAEAKRQAEAEAEKEKEGADPEGKD